MKGCEICSCSGLIIGPPAYSSVFEKENRTTNVPLNSTIYLESTIVTFIECPKCKGTGWYDPEEIREAPIKHINEDFWKFGF